MNTQRINYSDGSVIVYVFAISLFAVVVLGSYLQFVSVNRTEGTDHYYQRIAEQAAESGLAYALACYKNGSKTQTWGNTASSSPAHLTPRRNCSGVPIGSASDYVVENGNIRSTFTVGSIAASRDSGNIIVLKAVGTTQIVDTGTGSVLRTYEVTQHQYSKLNSANPFTILF